MANKLTKNTQIQRPFGQLLHTMSPKISCMQARKYKKLNHSTLSVIFNEREIAVQICVCCKLKDKINFDQTK